jgi:GNAT superfamily N-acetyltransferase
MTAEAHWEIKLIKADKKDFLELLLLADESESMIDRYLERGDLFALYDGGLRSVCVGTEESDDTCELKNIATYEEYHGKGYGSRLIGHVAEFYKGRYKTMLVGTGDVPKSLRFYQKNGFEVSHRLKLVIAPDTRLILSLLIWPEGSIIPLSVNVFVITSSLNFGR